MKIGIDATALTHARPTGVEVVTKNLIIALLAQAKDDQFIFYTPEPLDDSWQKYPNLINRVLPPKRFWLISQLSRSLAEDQLDVFWSPSNILPFKLPAKSIATVHDLAFMYFPQAYSLTSRLRSWLTVYRATKVATKIIAVSSATKSDLISRFNLPTNKVEVVPNALPQLPEAKVEVAAIDGDYILLVGRVELRKNPLTAIKAFGLIAKQYPKLQLVFTGSDGFGSQSARELAKTIGLADRIHFLGFVNGSQLANLYLHAKLVLFPSLYEGFGLPVLEAFHYGVPVIASDTPAVVEVAGDSAILVAPKDSIAMSQAISKLLDSPQLRAELIEKGARQLSQYSWEESATKLLSIIKQL